MFKITEKICELMNYTYFIDLSHVWSSIFFIKKFFETLSIFKKFKSSYKYTLKNFFKSKKSKKKRKLSDLEKLGNSIQLKEVELEKESIGFFMFQEKKEEDFEDIPLHDSPSNENVKFKRKKKSTDDKLSHSYPLGTIHDL